MHYYGKKVIILLDEYDTPMHEAYVGELCRFAAAAGAILTADFIGREYMDTIVCRKPASGRLSASSAVLFRSF